ncbi:hypothetical protein BaRGS_00004756 [Batillaria attramentaria]|uniref:protein-tyrosine-phosphatase n=1 Tax=Batillaria attramentaria TaxID=370345 RepID=A0ABD0LYA6_9CAEN
MYLCSKGRTSRFPSLRKGRPSSGLQSRPETLAESGSPQQAPPPSAAASARGRSPSACSKATRLSDPRKSGPRPSSELSESSTMSSVSITPRPHCWVDDATVSSDESVAERDLRLSADAEGRGETTSSRLGDSASWKRLASSGNKARGSQVALKKDKEKDADPAAKARPSCPRSLKQSSAGGSGSKRDERAASHAAAEMVVVDEEDDDVKLVKALPRFVCPSSETKSRQDMLHSYGFSPSPSQVTAVKGETAILPCRIEDLGSYRVLWSFERVLLTFDTRRIANDPRIEVQRPYQSEWNLKIDNIKQEDAGMYSCQINTNPVTRQDVKLIVLNEKPKPAAPKEVVVFSGSDVNIPCKLPDFNDVATWSYQADSRSERKTLDTGEGSKFTSRAGEGTESHVHTLEIKDVRATDEGLYYCRARGGSDTEIALKVVVPPPPPSLEAKARSPNEVLVSWERPQAREAEIVGYQLYVHDHETGEEKVFDVDPSEKKDGDEEFKIDDLATESTYTVQLATRLKLGDEVTLGKKSPEVNITTPLFVPEPPSWVKAKRVTDDAAEIIWSPAQDKTPGIIRGYTVIYGPLGANKKLSQPLKSIRVDKPDGNKWRTRLTGLKPKTRYLIRVAGYTRKGDAPDLSLNGRVLSTNSVLLTVDSLGSGKMTNVRMFYTEALEPSWKRLDFSPEWKFTVVGGLEPSTSYFFKVKAKISGRLKQSVTHITTPPHDLVTPQNVEVSATASTSIEVSWDYVPASDTSPTPLGYIVHLEESTTNGEAGKQHSQSVVFNMTSVEVKDLTPGSRYTIEVGAFNGFGEGPRTESILFHIAESDVKQEAVNQPYPPKFKHTLPERIEVERGETVKITCVAEGSPVPEVRWYDKGEPIGVPAQGSNQLYLANVIRSTVLTCRAVSGWGEIESSTIVDLKDEEPDTSGLTLDMFPEKVRMTTFTAAWTLGQGDPASVKRFDIDIKDARGRVLLTRSLPGQTRSFNLHGLQPGTEYRVELKAFEGLENSGEPLRTAQIAVTTLTEEPDEQEATTADSSATIEWDFVGLDPRYVQLYELKVKSRSNITLLTKPLKPNLRVRAFDRRGQVLAENTTEVLTSTTAPTDNDDAKDETPPVLRQASLTLSTHAITGDSARLDWTLMGTDSVGSFNLVVTDTSDRPLLRQDVARDSRSLTLNNLTPRTTYKVVLNALDDKGATIATTEESLTTTTEAAATSRCSFQTQLHSETTLQSASLKKKELNVRLVRDQVPSETTKRADAVDTSGPLRVYTEELDKDSVKIAWDTPHGLLKDISAMTVTLRDIANVTLLEQQMSPRTRSLTVSNLQSGERYSALVKALGHRREVLKRGDLVFDTNPTAASSHILFAQKFGSEHVRNDSNCPLLLKNSQNRRNRDFLWLMACRVRLGMPGRPQVLRAVALNNSAVQLEWRNTPSPAPAPGSGDINGYIINFATVDRNNQPTRGTYQFPLFGSVQSVVIPNLQGGQKYKFQVAARNQYAFGPLSVPVFTEVPKK